MPNQPSFNVNDKVCIIKSVYVVPEYRGSCGIVIEVRKGNGFSGQRSQPGRWSIPHEYHVEFAALQGKHWIPEGLLEPPSN